MGCVYMCVFVNEVEIAREREREKQREKRERERKGEREKERERREREREERERSSERGRCFTNEDGQNEIQIEAIIALLCVNVRVLMRDKRDARSYWPFVLHHVMLRRQCRNGHPHE